ncbi:MAG: hypothetical protein Q4F11_06830 [Eubacteriales bacterium]|nr:hypothetical protein [Eubacteriales bacterium]
MNKKTWKRITALAVVILWGMLLITTLVTALIDNEFCNRLFQGLIFADIVLPVVSYAMLLMYKFFSKKNVQ